MLPEEELERAIGAAEEETDRRRPGAAGCRPCAAAKRSPRQPGSLVRSDSSALAVLDDAGERVIGWLSHRDILRVYDRRLKQDRARQAASSPRLRSPGSPSEPTPRTQPQT